MLPNRCRPLPAGLLFVAGALGAPTAGAASPADSTTDAIGRESHGEWTKAGAATGSRGTAVRVGDDVYAGGNGDVYRRTDGGGWEKHGSDGWQPLDLPSGGGGGGRR